MYQDILAALLNNTIDTAGLRDVMEIAERMSRLGITLAQGDSKQPEASDDAKRAASVVEGHITIDKAKLPASLDGFKKKWQHLAASENKIKLIKELREVYGMGLADAKHCIEALYRI